MYVLPVGKSGKDRWQRVALYVGCVGEPAEHVVDPPAQHQVPPRHAALPLLTLLPGLP